MKKYCIVYIEHEGEPASDPAVIPCSALSKGYNLLEVFDSQLEAVIEGWSAEGELQFFFHDTGYAIPPDGETYATAWHGESPRIRLLVSLTDDIF